MEYKEFITELQKSLKKRNRSFAIAKLPSLKMDSHRLMRKSFLLYVRQTSSIKKRSQMY